MPDLLLQRLQAPNQSEEYTSDHTTALFFDFMNLNSLVEKDDDIETLLWFWDEGSQDHYEWDDALRILKRPKELIRTLKKAPERRNAAEKSVNGLRKFLVFCVALEELLEEACQYTELQSAVWHYHGYWFRIIKGKIRGAIEESLKEFERWLHWPTAKKFNKEEFLTFRNDAKESLKQVRESVSHLTSSRYSQGLRRVAALRSSPPQLGHEVKARPAATAPSLVAKYNTSD